MNHIQPKFICFQSLPAYGSVGLKAYAEELHQHWIPVPSVLLNGPGNMPGCERFPFDSVSMLESTV
ncbi:MAG: hypothetical protein MI748_05355, partial [Opitutales bacterium]|nr:hypothetical protein [Opitutales bacterium]